MTKVVHCKKEFYDFYGGRPSFLGNPVKIGDLMGDNAYVDRKFAVDYYRNYFSERIKVDKEFREKVLALAGQTLACWCSPKACHLDIVAEWLNKNERDKNYKTS